MKRVGDIIVIWGMEPWGIPILWGIATIWGMVIQGMGMGRVAAVWGTTTGNMTIGGGTTVVWE